MFYKPLYSFPQVDLVTGLAIEEACYAQVCKYDYMKKTQKTGFVGTCYETCRNSTRNCSVISSANFLAFYLNLPSTWSDFVRNLRREV